jgi:hypothetical protein
VMASPTEFSPGAPYEQLSAEKQRRRTAGASWAYGTGATGAAAVGTGLGNAKIAGTKSGQATLKGLQLKAKRANSPIEHDLGRAIKLGQHAASHRKLYTAGTAVASAAAAALGAGHRFRENEEQGISQGIGRIRAGRTYQTDQSRLLSKGLGRALLMHSDADLAELARAATQARAHVGRNKTAYTAGSVGTAIAAGGAAGVHGSRRRGLAASELRSSGPVRPTNIIKAQPPNYRQTTRGSAETASGSVLAGTGLLAGGLPGVREPNTRRLASLADSPHGSRVRSAGQKARAAAPLPRAGILGYRAAAHDAYSATIRKPRNGSAYMQGVRSAKLGAEDKIAHQLRLGRRATYALTGAGVGLIAAGRHSSRSQPVRKDAQRADNMSSAALGGGATLAAVGHVVPKGMRRGEKHFSDSAKSHVLAAQHIAPHFGGLKQIPAKYGPTGKVVRPAKQSMYPVREDHNLTWRDSTPEYKRSAVDRIKGGAAVRAQAGYHRGVAGQHRHFAEVFDSTASAIRRARGPGLGLAAVGGAGLLATRTAGKPSRPVSKAQPPNYRRTTRVHPVHVAEGTAGAGLIGYAASTKLAPSLPKEVADAIAALGFAKTPDRIAAVVRGVPKRYRPHIATLAGVALLHLAHPLTSTHDVRSTRR